MQKIDRLLAVAKQAGFTGMKEMDVSGIELLSEVRDMCAENKCGKYAKNWACPPGCGTLDECAAEIGKYKYGIIAQSTCELEDSMDYEGMMELSKTHTERFYNAVDMLREEFADVLPLGAGCCTRCKECTFPDAPCRFPEKRFSSMESYGMLVSRVCTQNGIPYYYGPNTLTYTACFLIN